MDFLKRLPLIFLSLLISSCYETFDPKVDSTPVLCLNSLITAGEPIDLEVTRTWLYTDEAAQNDHSVNDATVTVFANGEQVEPGYSPKEGDVIRIHAYSPTYGEAEAEVTVPVPSSVSHISFEPIYYSVTDDDNTPSGRQRTLNFSINVEMGISDLEDLSEHYILDQSTFCNVGSFWEGSINLRDPILTEYISTMEDWLGYTHGVDVFFSDRQFSSHPHTIVFGYNGCHYSCSLPEISPDGLECGMEFTLWTISESYYKWLLYRWQSEDGMLSDFIDMTLADQMWGYSNVSTGAGVVAARSSYAASIDLAPFIMGKLQND